MEQLVYIKALQNYMLEHNLNQDEMARRLGVSPAALGKWLLGRNGITKRNQAKIHSLCEKWMKDPADVIADYPEDAKEQLRYLVASLGRASLARQSDNQVSAAVELFRHLVIVALYDIDMPIVVRNRAIRAVSNIEIPDSEESPKQK